jgi:hypothetical protein
MGDGVTAPGRTRQAGGQILERDPPVVPESLHPTSGLDSEEPK